MTVTVRSGDTAAMSNTAAVLAHIVTPTGGIHFGDVLPVLGAAAGGVAAGAAAVKKKATRKPRSSKVDGIQH